MALRLILDRKGMYVYPWYISDMMGTADMAAIAGINVEKTFEVITKDFLAMYYDGESSERIGEVLTERVLSDKAFFEQVVKNIYGYAEELLTFSEEASRRDLAKLSDKELLHIYEEYTHKLRAVRVWGTVPVFMDGLTETFLSNSLLARFDAHMAKLGMSDKMTSYYSTLSSSEKESEVQHEEIERLELAGRLKAGGDVEAALQAHAQKFGSLTYGYSGPAMGVEYLRSVLAEDTKSDIQKRLADIREHYATISQEKARLAKEVQLPEDLAYAFQVSSELMYMKDWRKGAYQRSYLLMDTVLTELAHRLGYSLKEIKYLTLDEVREALLGGKRDIYKQKAVLRLDHCCFVSTGGVTTVYEGGDCEVIEKELIPATAAGAIDTDITELKGMTAYSGTVRGVVKIVLTTEDIAKVNEGDILVSSATNPDLMMAMRKAGAFVTDTGGIISHAAIVSREMKKPCIVGTRHATHVFKDGDMVEVDGERGIVRKI